SACSRTKTRTALDRLRRPRAASISPIRPETVRRSRWAMRFSESQNSGSSDKLVRWPATVTDLLTGPSAIIVYAPAVSVDAVSIVARVIEGALGGVALDLGLAAAEAGAIFLRRALAHPTRLALSILP